MSTTPRARYTVGAYVVSQHGVLLLWHLALGAWVPAGGDIRLPDGELPHEAALRSVREEVGLETTILDPEDDTSYGEPGVRPLPRPVAVQELSGDAQRYVDFVYFCRNSEAPPALNYEQARAFHWFDERDLERFPLRDHVKHHGLMALRSYAAATN